MILSERGVELIEKFEECRLTAYQDQRGVWTIGYGHTGPDVYPGLKWTQEQADYQLFSDTATAQNAVREGLDRMGVTQNQFDALCSLTFNIGVSAFLGSTLLKKLNAGDIAGASAQFPLWDHVDGQIDPGLLERRKLEQALFNEPDSENV